MKRETAKQRTVAEIQVEFSMRNEALRYAAAAPDANDAEDVAKRAAVYLRFLRDGK